MHNSGASRREIADAHLKLAWLFEIESALSHQTSSFRGSPQG